MRHHEHRVALLPKYHPNAAQDQMDGWNQPCVLHLPGDCECIHPTAVRIPPMGIKLQQLGRQNACKTVNRVRAQSPGRCVGPTPQSSSSTILEYSSASAFSSFTHSTARQTSDCRQSSYIANRLEVGVTTTLLTDVHRSLPDCRWASSNFGPARDRGMLRPPDMPLLTPTMSSSCVHPGLGHSQCATSS